MVLEIRKPIGVWNYSLGFLETQFMFGSMVLEFIKQTYFHTRADPMLTLFYFAKSIGSHGALDDILRKARDDHLLQLGGVRLRRDFRVGRQRLSCEALPGTCGGGAVLSSCGHCTSRASAPGYQAGGLCQRSATMTNMVPGPLRLRVGWSGGK